MKLRTISTRGQGKIRKGDRKEEMKERKENKYKGRGKLCKKEGKIKMECRDDRNDRKMEGRKKEGKESEEELN